MGVRGVLERYRVGTRIYAGFGVVLVLLAGLAWVAVGNLQQGVAGLDDYARVAGNTIGVVGVTADFAEMRRNVILFSDSGDDRALVRARALSGQIRNNLETLAAATRAADRKQELRDLAVLVDRYAADLDRAVELRRDRERMFTETMAGLAGRVADNVAAAVRQATADQDFPAAAGAATAQNAFTLARFLAARYLGGADPKFADEAGEKVAAFRAGIEALLAGALKPGQTEPLKAAAGSAAEYQQRLAEGRVLIQSLA